MAVDIKDAGALAGIVRYGVPWHGRIEGGVLYTGKLDALGAEITRAWPQPVTQDCWLIRKPGLPDPYAGAAAAKAEAALEGKELTNWALLSGEGNIHGKAYGRNRWIWIDDDGNACMVALVLSGSALTGTGLDWDGLTPRDFSFGSNWTATFNIKRFGHLVEDGEPPAATVSTSCTFSAADIGQDAPTIIGVSGGNILLRDISQTGARAVFEVHSRINDAQLGREYTRSLGYIEFVLSGTAEAPSAAFNVLATRTQTLGTYSVTGSDYICTTPNSCTLMSGTTSTVWESGGFTDVRNGSTTIAISGRIVGYVYADGVAVPVLLDANYVGEYQTYRSETFSSNGSVWEYSGTRSRSFTTNSALSLGLSGASVESSESSFSGSSGGGTPECTSETATTYIATGFDAVAINTTSATCEPPTDPSWCGFGLACGTIPAAQPSEDAKNAALYNLPITGPFSNVFSHRLRKYSGALFALQIAGVGLNKIIGCAALTTSNTTPYPLASATYAALNPATGELAYPKTARVNFT